MSVKCIFLISGETCIKTFTGKCCALPFVFRGAAVNRCLIDPKTNRSWCAVTPNFDTEKRWGYCQGSGEHTTRTWQSSTLINCVPGHKCIAILPTHIALLSSIRFFFPTEESIITLWFWISVCTKFRHGALSLSWTCFFFRNICYRLIASMKRQPKWPETENCFEVKSDTTWSHLVSEALSGVHLQSRFRFCLRLLQI